MKLERKKPIGNTFPSELCFRSRAGRDPIQFEPLDVPPLVEGEITNLISLDKLDIQIAFKWMTDKEITSAYISYPPPQTIEEEKKWLQTRLRNNGLTEIGFVIQTKDNETIGIAHLINIDRYNNTAKLGILIGEKKLWGKGYGTDAARTLLKYAFEKINLNKVYSLSLPFAEQSISLAKEIGFEHEATLKEEGYFNGKYEDIIYLSILKRDYEYK